MRRLMMGAVLMSSVVWAGDASTSSLWTRRTTEVPAADLERKRVPAKHTAYQLKEKALLEVLRTAPPANENSRTFTSSTPLVISRRGLGASSAAPERARLKSESGSIAHQDRTCRRASTAFTTPRIRPASTSGPALSSRCAAALAEGPRAHCESRALKATAPWSHVGADPWAP